MELKNYEQRIGKSRHIEVKINCETCGTEKWVKWTRVKNGQGRFCSIKCANKGLGFGKKYVGKENAKQTFDKSRNIYTVYWFDPITLKRCNSSYVRWWWEMNKGEIPENYRASYKDGNTLNIDPENICIISPEEFGKAVSERLMGHTFSDETLKKMSEAKLGKPLSEEHKQNISKATKKMWKRGVFDAPEIREAYAKQGRSTKGKTISDEHKKKVADAHRGKKMENAFTKEAIEKRRQKLLGGKQTEESNKKRSDALKGREFSDEHLEKLSIAGKNRTDNKGENSRWWRGGVESPYPDEFDSRLKRKIRKRDKYICQACGISTYGSKTGHVHHIDGDKQNCSDENLTLLCATCHNAVHNRNTITNDKIEKFRKFLIIY